MSAYPITESVNVMFNVKKPTPPDLFGVPEQYHNLREVFKKEKALYLPPTGPMTVLSSYRGIPSSKSAIQLVLSGGGGHGTVDRRVTNCITKYSK